jgi:hypothetical protein
MIAFLWRKSGVEKIKLRANTLLYKRSMVGKGKIKNFQFNFIKDFKTITAKENSFIENINNSYWVFAGERFVFDYMGKEIKFGIQLPDKDAEQLYKVDCTLLPMHAHVYTCGVLQNCCPGPLGPEFTCRLTRCFCFVCDAHVSASTPTTLGVDLLLLDLRTKPQQLVLFPVVACSSCCTCLFSLYNA